MTTEVMTVDEALAKIQQAIKVPKTRDNKFGGYKYRNAEDILDAAKQLANPLGFHVTLNDEIVTVGSRFYVRAVARIANASGSIECIGMAREEESKKGMDGSQVTGASSSYARKYALNGLFAIDDGIDSDTTNDGSAAPKNTSKSPANNAPATKPPAPSPEIVRAGQALKAAIEAYDKTEAAKSAPAKALLHDTLHKNGIKSLRDLGSCTNVMVFQELLSEIQAAMGGVPA